ncbi:flagellar filament capping protein FliD [Enterobacter kobei]|uniref:Flagellar hook protein n=1 Tax=Enterobacter kobei TaxID=208224 RepID=A0ACC8S9S6_9ENTR|nr:flagellar filament capping protein FliD [Enterobacter kobei]OLR20253.1 flagellar hook protein [Enterobacter kobei]
MINPQQIAKKFALMDISTKASSLARQQNDIDTQTSALDSLDSALTAFQSAVDALNSETGGPVVNTVTANNDSATITADSTAEEGSYTFFVDQLATAQQSTLAFADGDIPSSGTFTITMGDSEMDIDLSTVDSNVDGSVSVAELADAINDSPDNPGVTATIVNTNGATTLMLTADDTGAENAFTVSASGIDPASAFATDISNQKDLAVAQDSVVYLGSSPETGVMITSSSNTHTDLIPGVSITFAEESADGEPLTFSVKNDSSASQEKVQTFVDAYNTLVDTLDGLTTNGGGTGPAGPLAGGAGISSLERQIEDITHASYNGVSIVDYGITLDSDGHLQIDSEKFDDAMEENPDGLTALFVGPDSMTAQLDSLMETWLDDTDGIISQRQSNLDDKQEKVTNSVDDLKTRYNTSYERYLEEFTSTLVEIESMQMSMAAFM